MPFDDEMGRPVTIVDYDARWPAAFEALATRLAVAGGTLVSGIDHVGSTAVPWLPAKDCIDVQLRVDRLDEGSVTAALEAIGLRRRTEPWNRVEIDGGRRWPKMVFAPPRGERASNIHVREVGSTTIRRNLLFRDFLRADTCARTAWGEFKRRLAHRAPELADYGGIKQPATDVLMLAAEDWALRTGWTAPPFAPVSAVSHAERMTVQIAVRLDDALAEQAKVAASNAGTTLSEWVRVALQREVTATKAARARSEKDARTGVYTAEQEAALTAARRRRAIDALDALDER